MRANLPSRRRPALPTGRLGLCLGVCLALVAALLLPGAVAGAGTAWAAAVAPRAVGSGGAPGGVTTRPVAATRGPAAAGPAVVDQRLGGVDRYATAAAVARATYPSGTATAVVARGDDFPDALAAAPLVARLHAALLLTEPDVLPVVTSDTLAALGVHQVIVLGGTGAVSTTVAGQLAQHYTVSRIAGVDRYGTAAAIATRLVALGAIRTVSGEPAAFFVTGEDFPDAVVAGAPASAGVPAPVLLVQSGDVPYETVAALQALHIRVGYVLGGGGPVSAVTAARLQALGVNVTRIGGADRSATAAAVADAFRGTLPARTVVLTRGDAFPDALVAGPYAGHIGAPVLLTGSPNGLGNAATDQLLADSVSGGALGVTTVGGTGAVSDAVVAQADTAAAGAAESWDCPATTFKRLTTAQRVGQLIMVGVDAATGPSAAAVAAITSQHAGSVILTGRSSEGVTATRARTDALQRLATTAATGGVPLLVATDQEGGEVQVLSGPGFSTMPTALVQGTFATTTLHNDATIWGRQLAAAGVTENLAPVMDVVPAAEAQTNQPIGRYDREFGYTPAVVAPHGVAFATGMAAAHVAATLKHFPGLGRADGNTDTTAGVTDTVTTATDPFLDPFLAGIRAGAPFVMMSTAIYTKLDHARVAAFSSAIVRGLLRAQLGFAGVVISDDLGGAASVEAIPVGQRAVDFIAAGGDLVLTVTPTVVSSMVGAVLSEAAVNAGFRRTVDAAVLQVLRQKGQQGLLPCG